MGIRATLLRPPYAIDEEPDTADQVKPLEFAQDMGYITVGNRIDPNDWSDKPRRHTAEEISATFWHTCRRAPPDDLRCGNIVLLHDGGGNRAETVRALPMIIEGIRARGYSVAAGVSIVWQDPCRCNVAIEYRAKMGCAPGWAGLLAVRGRHRFDHVDILRRRPAHDRAAAFHWHGCHLRPVA